MHMGRFNIKNSLKMFTNIKQTTVTS